MTFPRRPLAVTLVVLGSVALVGCEETMLPRGKTMAVQDARYQTYAPLGSTGTIEHPGAFAGGMSTLAASSDVDADKGGFHAGAMAR